MNLTNKQQQSIKNLKPHESNYWSLMTRVNDLVTLMKYEGIKVEVNPDTIGYKPDLSEPSVHFFNAYHANPELGHDTAVHEDGVIYLHWSDKVSLDQLKSLIKEADLLCTIYEDRPEEEVQEIAIKIYQSRTWVNYDFSLEEEYYYDGLDTADDEVLKGYFSDVLSCYDDTTGKDMKIADKEWLTNKLTELGLEEDLKYLNAITKA